MEIKLIIVDLIKHLDRWYKYKAERSYLLVKRVIEMEKYRRLCPTSCYSLPSLCSRYPEALGNVALLVVSTVVAYGQALAGGDVTVGYIVS